MTPGTRAISVCVNAALIRRPRMAAAISVEPDCKYELAGVDVGVRAALKLPHARTRLRQGFVQEKCLVCSEPIAASASRAPHGVILVFPLLSGAGRAAGIGSRCPAEARTGCGRAPPAHTWHRSSQTRALCRNG